MKGYRKYFVRKGSWFLLTLFIATVLNFFLPRLMPGDPVNAIMQGIAMGGGMEADHVRRIHEHFVEEFGLNRPVWEQFLIYLRNLFRGDLGLSFSQFPRPVSDIIRAALPWTLALQIPAIIIGWIVGNVLGALAAYIRKGFDKIVMPIMLFIAGVPAFGMAVVLLTVFAANLGWFPVQGAYPHVMIPSFSWSFFAGLLHHYHLPFWSIVLIAIGGQALGMRSMSIYELNADYVKYARFMGIRDSKVVMYVFRNAMLPQITGLAMALGGMVGGALVAEVIFSYPGLGSTILAALTASDYALISATTLIITIMVLIFIFILDIVCGFIDPRVKATLIIEE